MKKALVLSLFLALLVSGCGQRNASDDSRADEAGKAKNEITQPGPASDNLIFKPVKAEEAPEFLLDEKIDMYLAPLEADQANKLKDSNVDIYKSSSQFFSIEINPAPSTKDVINPFSDKKVRFALNNLIPKQKIVDELFGGYGSPKDIALFKDSNDYNLLKDILDKFDFSYKPDEANEVISKFMEASGAKKTDGKWLYKGKPVEIKYLIYEGADYNKMQEVNGYIAGVLEKAGFTVKKINYNDANMFQYSQSNPKDLEWNLVSSGGIYFSASNYNDYIVSQAAPYQKYLLGSQKEGNWNYKNEELDRIGKKLYDGDYSDEAEWKSLVRSGAEIVFDEAYIVYIATKDQVFAANKKIEGLTANDFTAIRLLQNYREINIPGKEKLVIGTQETYKETDPLSYNYLAANIYRMDIKMSLMDFGLWNNPKTLESEKLRWDYKIDTAGPKGKLDVPEDAFMWKNSKWNFVGKKIKATTKISYDLSKYVGTNWQNGEKITWADILYAIATEYEKVENKKWNEITKAEKMYLEKYKGYRINGDQLEVYVDEWHFNNRVLANNNSFSVYPWILSDTENTLVYDDRAFMYSQSLAEKYKVPAMRLVNKDQIKSVLEKMDKLDFDKQKKFFTVGDKVYANEDEFIAGKAAIKKWAAERNNLIICDGPFMLYSFDEKTGEVTLKAVRDGSYPFKKGDWLVK